MPTEPPPQVQTFSDWLVWLVVGFLLWLLARERTKGDKVLTDHTAALNAQTAALNAQAVAVTALTETQRELRIAIAGIPTCRATGGTP